MAEQRNNAVVVIGASAGGIEALTALVRTLPANFPAPIVIAQHLDPRRESHLDEILASRSTLPVRRVSGQQPLEPGTLFVVPQNMYVEIVDDEVHVTSDDGRPPLPSIDLLFTTAAASYGESTIAVILSGTGNDGAAGARDVKAAGGTIVVQNPETASFPGMPLSLPPSIVDIVANLDTIGQLLGDLLSGEYPLRPPDDDQQLRNLLDRLRERSGIDFSVYKTPTIMRRLQRRMAATGAARLSEYERYLHNNPDEYARLVNSFLIKVTEFFRDPDLFDYLRDRVLPGVIEDARGRGELRVWSAGCATGEEAYSLAILISEVLGNEIEHLRVRIFATDLDADAVAFARRGIYPSSALAAMSPEMVELYFTRSNGAYEVRKEIRALVVFGQHDLGQRAPFPRMDITLCRNVLIYFTVELQKRALQLFAFSLRDEGYLVLGKAETVSPLPEFFALDQARLKVYRRVGERVMLPTARIRDVLPTLAPPIHANMPRAGLAARQRQEPSESTPNVERAESILLRMPVGIVVVNQNYDIQIINGMARRLLGIHTEAIGKDLIHLVQHIPIVQLRDSIDAAFAGEVSTLAFNIAADLTATGESFDLDVRSYPTPPGSQGGGAEQVTIVVQDTSQIMRDRRASDGEAGQLRDVIQRATGQIERLTQANRALVSANEELTTANAELRSANEEMLVANEEVQSATEEVETLNEELQATNEELETLNEELQATVEELNTTNDDLQARSLELQDLAISLDVQNRETEARRERLQAILDNISDAVLVVDARGEPEPVVANNAFRTMFGAGGELLVPEDAAGEPLRGAAMLQQRVARGESFTADFTLTAADGIRRWFEAKAQPIAAASGEQLGVIAIRDITDRSMRQLQDEFLALASHELRSPLTSLSGNLQLILRRHGASLDEQTRRMLDVASSQTHHLTSLVNELVDVVRLQTGRMWLTTEPINLVDVVRQAVDAAQGMTDGQTIEPSLPSEPVVVAVDRIRLSQVLTNLLANAITYAPGADRIEIGVRRADGLAEVTVHDFGPGVPESERERIFQRFSQVELSESDRRQGAGLGLGLYIAREIVAAHGGTLTVEETTDPGATFIVRLPLTPGESS
jgi:two-component system CheB/CheR fusion protein